MTKRIKNKNFVKIIYPFFFWKECFVCGEEFRREYGFKQWENYFISSAPLAGRYRYLCNSCGKNRDNANDVFGSLKTNKR